MDRFEGEWVAVVRNVDPKVFAAWLRAKGGTSVIPPFRPDEDDVAILLSRFQRAGLAHRHLAG